MRAHLAISRRARVAYIRRGPGETHGTSASADDRPRSILLPGVVSMAWRRHLRDDGLARMALSISARLLDPVRTAGASIAGTTPEPCAWRTADERQHSLGLRCARRQLLRATSR